jgi:NAD(P)-dependent dehydrogenase (short-subunit alcohol dehydrogenase family)
LKVSFVDPYAVRKAALNTQAVQCHNELNGHDFTVVPLHPGLVVTDIGHLAGKEAMSVQKSVEGALKVTGYCKKEDCAIFLFHGRRGFNK